MKPSEPFQSDAGARCDHIRLMSPATGTESALQVMRFGTPGQGPKAHIQAALHADEVPAILVARQLARRLAALEGAGALRGEVVLVPFANPIGLAQQHMGAHQGRFDLRDGRNFNRGYADLAALAAPALEGRLTGDEAANAAAVRRALSAAARALPAHTPTEDLKRQLLRLAIDADIVLDLHCDTEAVMHVYALTPQSAQAELLGAAVGAQAVLLATESGDGPFDEACSRPWLALRERFPDHPIPLGCFSATVELRGETDTDHRLAQRDAEGLCHFLASQGVIDPRALDGSMPAPLCRPTPLSGSEPITAPHDGVIVFHRRPGERVAAGDLIADLVDAGTGRVTPLHSRSDGLLYARCGQRWAHPGKRLAKIAGTSLARTGVLLSP